MTYRAVFSFLLLLLFVAQAPAQVKIDKTPVTVETKYFDPKKPPADMPKLKPNEAAVCVSNFNISAGSGGEIVDQRAVQTGTRASVTLSHLNVTLGCDIVMWLPRGASKRIVEHEDAHRLITEFFYDSADTIAKRLATPWIGQTVVGNGTDTDAAAKAAIQSAVKQFTGQYMTAIHGESSKVQEAFDRISVHGTNKLTAKQGMDQAFDEYERGKR